VNLDSAASPPTVTPFDPDDPASFYRATSVTVYDSLGQEHLAEIFFLKTGTNAWAANLRVDNDPAYTPAAAALSFDASGNLLTAMPVSFAAYTPGNGAQPMSLEVNLTGSTQHGGEFATTALSQDGYEAGRLSGLDIDEEGVIFARYTNGEAAAQGQVVLANFTNPQGLQPQGDTMWAETAASGPALLGTPGSGSLGLLQAGALEESNVDLAEQLVNMIIAQRNFQASAQVIRTEDQVTQSIINMR
jgi:flagellar hook protein FlgE